MKYKRISTIRLSNIDKRIDRHKDYYRYEHFEESFLDSFNLSIIDWTVAEKSKQLIKEQIK